jgi:hypothetical protein
MTDFFECQNVFARKPDVIVLGHAVLAPQVAPVGDRDPEAPQGAAKSIDNGHEANIMTELLRL